jgi:hypothetical protein
MPPQHPHIHIAFSSAARLCPHVNYSTVDNYIRPKEGNVILTCFISTSLYIISGTTQTITIRPHENYPQGQL